MSLIKCEECGKEISDKAGSCPNCGCPVNLLRDEKQGLENQNNNTMINSNHQELVSYAKELLGKNNSDNVVINELMHNYKELDYDTACNIVKESKLTNIDEQVIDNSNKLNFNEDTEQFDDILIIKDALKFCGKKLVNTRNVDKIKEYIIDKYKLDEDQALNLAQKVSVESQRIAFKYAGITFIFVLILFVILGILDSDSSSSNYANQAQKEVRNILSSGIIFGYTSYVVGEVYHVSCVDYEQDGRGRHLIQCTAEYYPKRNNGLTALDSRRAETIYGIGMKLSNGIDINYKYLYVGLEEFKKENCWNQDKSMKLSCHN